MKLDIISTILSLIKSAQAASSETRTIIRYAS